MTDAQKIKLLREALELAIRQNSQDMILTGEEIRACRIAPATTEQREEKDMAFEPENVPYLIFFDDADRKPEMLIGREAALKRYEQISISWNAHLFVKIDSNSRDAKYPNLDIAALKQEQDDDFVRDVTPKAQESPNIERYDLHWEWMTEHPDGNYVRYEDHIATIKALKGE